LSPRSFDAFAAIAGDILSTGIGIIHRSSKLQRAYDALYAIGIPFFGIPAEIKSLCLMPADRNTGYTPVGVEYSIAPDVPDQKESITYIRAERRLAASQPSFVQPLYAAMADCVDAVHPLASGIMRALAERFGSDDALCSPDYSQLALNSCAITNAPRDVLIEPHEDGCLLTVLSSTAPGLELQHRSGAFRTCDEVIANLVVIAGRSLTLATSGAVPPTFHRVMRTPWVSHRYTIAYDVNVDIARAVTPWGYPESDTRLDIDARLTLTRFGLAPLGQEIK